MKKAQASVASVNRASTSTSSSLPRQSQTLSDCLNRNTSFWSLCSTEHTKREKSLINMFIETGTINVKQHIPIHLMPFIFTTSAALVPVQK